ncbi:MAG: hypothetical protein U0270_00050 [Labilithrix sp.]
MNEEAKRKDAEILGLAGSALLITVGVAVAAKIAGVLIAPGARGNFGEKAVVLVETLSGALAYTLTALLVALVCAASFELARTRAVNVIARGSVVAITGLIVALASPAVVERLSTLPSLALGVVTSLAVLVAGLVVLRTRRMRAIGAVLALFSTAGLLRVIAYEMSAASYEHLSVGLHNGAKVLATVSVTAQSVGILIAAAWIGTRSRWKGRVLANAAILVAFGLTWLAARGGDSPSALESVLRTSLPAAASITPQPYFLGSIAAFLVPASILLSGVVLALVEESPLVVAPLALVLLSNGIFDVPLHAMLATAGAQWAMLVLTAEAQRSGVQQPMSAPTVPPIEYSGMQ